MIEQVNPRTGRVRALRVAFSTVTIIAQQPDGNGLTLSFYDDILVYPEGQN